MPRSISASARRSPPSSARAAGARSYCAGSADIAGASSRCASPATASRSPRWRARRIRTTASTACALPPRPAGTEPSFRVARARYRSASSSDPRASWTPATRAASSASAAITPAGKRARSSCAVPPSPARPRPTQRSDSRRAASAQSCAAWACRTASTGYPCSAYQPAAASCNAGSLAGSVPLSSSCRRSAKSWW